MKLTISGLINIETNVKIDKFPIEYQPINYPFFGIKSNVSGVGYNIVKAMKTLGNDIKLISYIANDNEAKLILNELENEGINTKYIFSELKGTPTSVILYDTNGKRQIYCDLKDIQDKSLSFSKIEKIIEEDELVILCNINFNRSLLEPIKKSGKLIATDLHVLSDIHDEYNKDFMKYADILFLSDEKLPCSPQEFIKELKKEYSPKIIVIGLGKKGAMLYDSKENKIFKLDAIPVENVVNTVGAGDALFSSFLNYYVKGYEALEALKRAEMFAALKIGVNGASNGFSTEEVIEKELKKYDIIVSEIK